MRELTRRLQVGEVELAWDEWGSGPTLLLCHGFSGSAHDFVLHVPQLAAGRRVVALDHRGHGRSERAPTYSIAELAGDLAAFADKVIGEPFDLLGHSMGGRLAMELVLSRPELVRSLVLMDTSAGLFTSEDPGVRAFIEEFLAGYDPASGLPDVGALRGPEDELIDLRTPADWQARKLELSAAFDPVALKTLGTQLWVGPLPSLLGDLATVTCPTTVIVGEHDHPLVDQAPQLAAAVAGGRLVVIEGAYHSPQLTHADAWRAAVEAHLTGVVSPDPL
jgi:pimeloyl-ACP methyl ester carboxylesterase